MGWMAIAFVVTAFVFWVASMPRPAAQDVDADLGAPLPSVEAVSAVWAERISTETGITVGAARAYAAAAIGQDARTPACRIGWNLLAAVLEARPAGSDLGDEDAEGARPSIAASVSVDDLAHDAAELAATLCADGRDLGDEADWDAALASVFPDDPVAVEGAKALAAKYAEAGG